MKQADRSGAAFAVILEEDGSIKLRDMESGEQREVGRAELPRRSPRSGTAMPPSRGPRPTPTDERVP